MATLKDVAKLAHVDVSTVSRALNNTSYVHPDTKARIMAAVKELSYQPNLLAKGLKQGKRKTIGIVIPKLTFSIFADVASGAEETARKLGYASLICNTGDDKTVEKEGLNHLRNGLVDGILIVGTGANKRLLRDIQATGISIVQIIREQDPTLCSIVADYQTIGYNSVQHLYERGCRKIGLINGSTEIPPYARRYKGYRKAIREFGLEEITAEKEGFPTRDIYYGYECALKLIDENDSLDAIMAATDAQGIGVLRALKENKIKVPDEIKVLSMTGYQIGSMLETSLTSMELPSVEIGAQAAEMAIKSIEADDDHKPSLQHLEFPAHLVERESTGK
jgi:LacI family transcriptional regulator